MDDLVRSRAGHSVSSPTLGALARCVRGACVAGLACAAVGCGAPAHPPPPSIVRRAPPPGLPEALPDSPARPPADGLCDDPSGPGDGSGRFGDLVSELVAGAAKKPFEPIPKPVAEDAAPADLGPAFKKAREGALALVDKAAPAADRAKLRAELTAIRGRAFVLSVAADTGTRIVLVRYVVDKESKDDFLYMRHDSLLWMRGGVVRVIFQTRGDPTSALGERIEIDSAADLDGDGVADAMIDYGFARTFPDTVVHKDHGVYLASARTIWPRGPFAGLPSAVSGSGPFAPGPSVPLLTTASGKKLAVATGAFTLRCLDEDDKKPFKLLAYSSGRWLPADDEEARATLDHTCESVRLAAAWHPMSAPLPEAAEALDKRKAWAEQVKEALATLGAPKDRAAAAALPAAYLRRCP